MSFIEYLLESKSKKSSRLKRLAEAYQTPPQSDLRVGINLKLSVLKSALESECFDDHSEVKLVNVQSQQLKDCRNEFGWRVGSTVAEIHAKDVQRNHAAKVLDLRNDIIAMQQAGADIEHITVKIVDFRIAGRSSHQEILLGWNDQEQHPTLWVGIRTSAEELERFVMTGGEFLQARPQVDANAQQEAPQSQAAHQDADARQDRSSGTKDAQAKADIKTKVDSESGLNFREADAEALRSVDQVKDSLPLFVGKWTYENFLSRVRIVGSQLMSFFKAGNNAIHHYKQIDWDDGVDSFIKRLGLIEFVKTGEGTTCDAVMQLQFKGHPTTVYFKSVKIDLALTMLSQPCSRWYKHLVQLYTTQYKTSPAGIQVLADPDHFFKNNSKYRIQQNPPFTIGLAVQGQATATPNAVRPQAAMTARRRGGAEAQQETAEEALLQQLGQMLKQKDLDMVQTVFGIPTSKNGMRKTFGAADGGYKMLVNFPGIDKDTKLVDDKAIQFLSEYGIWNGMYKDVYDVVKAAHDDVQLVVKFDGDLV